MHPFEIYASLFAIGALTAFLSGMLGVGGGFLLVPALLLLGWDLPTAIGTSLAYVTFIGLGGAVDHARRGNVDWRFVAWTALPAVLGAQVGAHLTTLLPVWVLDCGFASMLVYAASELLTPRADEACAHAGPPPRGSAALGGAVGVLSGLLGVGGGILLVPGQTRWLKVPILRAIGNSLAVVVLTGISGVLAHMGHGNLAWRGGVWLLAGGAIGLPSGLAVLRRLSVATLKRFFVIFMGILAVYMAARGVAAAPFHR